MKTTYKILQLERLGKKQNKFIISRYEKSYNIEIISKIFGPTTLKNCENRLKKILSGGK